MTEMLTREELEAAGVRVAVAVPMERTLTDEAFLGFWQIAQRGHPLINNPPGKRHGYNRTDINRNELAYKFMTDPAWSDYTHLLMLDLDHRHPPDIVERLARWVAENPERWVVGGLNFRRGEPYEPCIYRWVDDQFVSATQWEQGLVRVDAIGHGSILFARPVFERLPAPWWGYAYNDESVGGTYQSDDIYFCIEANKRQIALYCDTTTTSPHLILGQVDEGVFRRWLAANQERVKFTGGNHDREIPRRRVRRRAGARAGT